MLFDNRGKNIMKNGDIVGNYKIVLELGRGSFGIVYEVKDVNKKKIYAMKMEISKENTNSQLKNEYAAYRTLAGCFGIPKVYAFGVHQKRYYLVLDRLGVSLQSIFEKRGKCFSIKTICLIGKKIIQCLKEIHEKGKLYRDMKPENILVDYSDSKQLYLVDFGMSKDYLDPSTNEHIPLINNKKLTGTARYASVNTHAGLEQSRRDDLENLGYVLVYFAQGTLPWVGIQAPTGKEKYRMIAKKKASVSNEVLCQGITGEKYFIRYFKYVKGLKFNDEPDYKFLISIFDKILHKYKYTDDSRYDWICVDGSESSADGKKTKKGGIWKRFKDILSGCHSEK
ncbi:Serine/threonine protein kinase [Spraguea lophii 42_110]|uniref:Serine/threonine protein kinase n=1 Tax=Spraguea lophii (strain 42_110) TaxID=1358809 RepID=S7XL67_SPRLO|nr:Serine/threonine protein kinase [Spraguea lophii 42_110]